MNLEIAKKTTFGFLRYMDWLISREISALSRYYDQLIQLHRLSHDPGNIFEAIEIPLKKQISSEEDFPDLSEKGLRSLILLNGNLNHHLDIQGLLTELIKRLFRTSRVVAVVYNPYFRQLFRLANFLGLRKAPVPSTFLTRTDLKHLAALAGFEVVKIKPVGYVPFKLLGLGSLVNYILPMLPVLRWFAFSNVILLRPLMKHVQQERPSVSIVIPARNEKGNIRQVLERIPDLGVQQEVVFVEGHSTDGTWEEIQKMIPEHSSRFPIRAFIQKGKGKSDAVRLGFSEAVNEILMILDADLSVPPEMLQRFYDAYCSGLADFVNGTRTVYAMEGGAMRFLNRLGNIFFAKLLSYVLDVALADSLCGTKVVAKHDYSRMIAWRKDFGEFDPFGDFELLFPAALLGLGIIDLPVRYCARTYGTTNISRLRHGLILMKMSVIGLIRIKGGKV